jgi:hypothetical protein
MVYLLKMVIFHGYQMVSHIEYISAIEKMSAIVIEF